MANLVRVRAVWNGATVVGGGVSTFYLLPAATDWTAKIRGMYEAIAHRLPIGTNITVQNSGETVDLATGKANGQWSEGTLVTVPGAVNANYAAGVGTRIVWGTDGFNNGRRVKGSTFIVPLSAACYDVQGNLDISVVNDLQDAAQDMVDQLAGTLVVWTRGPGPDTGATAVVTSGTVPDKISWLRSRRT